MTDTAAPPGIAASEKKDNTPEIELLATPFKVSRIGLGTWVIGGWMWGGTDETAAIGVIREAVDRGVTLIDTAPAYGFGRSEEIVGKALAEGGRRQHVVIATKVGLDWRDGQPFRDASKRRIHKVDVETLEMSPHRRHRSLSGALARSQGADRGDGGGDGGAATRG